MNQLSAQTRARIAFWATIAAYVVAVFGCAYVERRDVLPHAMLVAVTLLPMLPAFGTVLAGMAMFYARDELERQIQAEGMMFAFVITALATFGYGFLETIDAVPRASYFFVWAILGGSWAVGSLIARLRYR